jgi:hypothetical protein
MGALEETVTGWDEEKRMEIKIDSAAGLPIAHGLATFTLSGADTATDVSVEYRYKPKFGFLGHLMGRFMLDGQLTKGFASFLKDLEQASHKAGVHGAGVRLTGQVIRGDMPQEGRWRTPERFD